MAFLVAPFRSSAALLSVLAVIAGAAVSNGLTPARAAVACPSGEESPSQLTATPNTDGTVSFAYRLCSNLPVFRVDVVAQRANADGSWRDVQLVSSTPLDGTEQVINGGSNFTPDAGVGDLRLTVNLYGHDETGADTFAASTSANAGPTSRQRATTPVDDTTDDADDRSCRGIVRGAHWQAPTRATRSRYRVHGSRVDAKRGVRVVIAGATDACLVGQRLTVRFTTGSAAHPTARTESVTVRSALAADGNDSGSFRFTVPSSAISGTVAVSSKSATRYGMQTSLRLRRVAHLPR